MIWNIAAGLTFLILILHVPKIMNGQSDSLCGLDLTI